MLLQEMVSIISNMLDDVNADTWKTLNTVHTIAQWRTGPTGPPAPGRWAPTVSHLWGPLCL